MNKTKKVVLKPNRHVFNADEINYIEVIGKNLRIWFRDGEIIDAKII